MKVAGMEPTYEKASGIWDLMKHESFLTCVQQPQYCVVAGQSLLICGWLVSNLVFCLRGEVPAEGGKSHGCKE